MSKRSKSHGAQPRLARHRGPSITIVKGVSVIIIIIIIEKAIFRIAIDRSLSPSTSAWWHSTLFQDGNRDSFARIALPAADGE
ncbi:MAG: hypothetical protein O7E51_14375, partial [Acidobacteria bacterium]|nr:hypothetical protein [Acidobacteriota bacterium]